ncbi:MAG: hypothetical protein K2X72_12100 [Reyranella sp.]|nr:hypothetical protein [Reyranella sp.]
MKTIRKRQEPTRTDDSPLVAALIKQVRAHADELAFRLDAGGASSLHVGASAARLCQAVKALRGQTAGSRQSSPADAD